MDAMLNSLTERELALVREAGRDRLGGMDEDALADLHTRVRRARDRYVKLYRREASARVSEVGGRGKARPKNQRNAQKAEVFEDTLARVSRQLAAAARQSAAELKAERIAASRRDRASAPPRTARPASRGPIQRDGSVPRNTTTPAVRKRQASTLATGARRQARRDAR